MRPRANLHPGRRRTVLAVSSGGGHWVQLLRLRPAFAGERVIYATVSRGARADVGSAPFHAVNDATRWNPLGLAVLTLRLALIMVRRRPDVVITTGAAPGSIALVLGRLFGARTAWIDSMANVERLSASGRRVRRFADLWLTQWPHLAREGGPRCEGAVL